MRLACGGEIFSGVEPRPFDSKFFDLFSMCEALIIFLK